MTTNNPLLSTDYFPRFDTIKAEHAVPAMTTLLAKAQQEVDSLEASFLPTWDGLAVPLRHATEQLFETWGIISHLLSVMNSDAWRTAYETIQPQIITFSLRLGQSRRFYEGFCAIRDAGGLSQTQQRIITNVIRAAEHAGVGLPPPEKKRFNEIQNALGTESTNFSNTVLDAIKAYSMEITDPAEIDGLPQPIKALAANAAVEAGTPTATAADGPWRITLDQAVSAPFMMHVTNRERRRQLSLAMADKASKPPHDNSTRLETILALRSEKAALLGYPNFAALSLASKMAGNVAAVDALTTKLADASRAAARKENAELLEFARQHGFAEETLQPWDRPFWTERLSEDRYQYSDEELRAYFQFPLVLEGLFNLAQRLFDITITPAPNTAPLWHPDVKLFQVQDNNGTPMAWFYLDPYSRPATKRSGAWMNDFRNRALLPDGSWQLPLALIVCNQTPPTDTHPSLMRFSEVQTLFHEFGHTLQHMLTTVDEPDAAGLNCVEWDAVEIASQFMENWCYDRSTIKAISRHIETGLPIPDTLFDRIIASKNFMAASFMLRQLYLGATDMDLHARYPHPDTPTAESVKCANAVRYLPAPLLPEDRLLSSFSHIFAGGYAAGYYSYKWSEVLAADAFAAFEEAGLENDQAIRQTGRRFRDTILALGGSAPPLEIFIKFRGREPSITPLLRHNGLI
ncbi:MAG: M3 family metallopeptidase [Lentisphaerae bacterium]|nr:M3 family metallopeptidase [Lentisphaerota bacterium]